MYTSTLLLTLLPLLAHGAPTRHTRRGCEVEHRNSTLKSGHHHHHHLNNSSAVSSSSASSIVSITTTALVSTTTTTTTHSSMTTSSSAEAVIIASSSTPVLAVVSASPSVSATTLVNAEAVVAPAAAPTGSVTSSSSSGNHVGLGLNYDSGTDLNTFTDAPNSKLSWYYTWSLDSNSGADGIEFVPMVWGSSDVNSVASAAESWPSGTQYVLSFNERESNSSPFFSRFPCAWKEGIIADGLIVQPTRVLRPTWMLAQLRTFINNGSKRSVGRTLSVHRP